MRVTMAELASQPTDLANESADTNVQNGGLLGELARAMHAAASSQYERMNTELERRRTEQVEAIAARASTEAENLKAGVDEDISAIDAWAKAETEKIKLEKLRRIDARREQLASELERQETIRQREVFAIEVAIDAHRSEVDQFFGRMERESDPTAIARVAASMPPFPSLVEIAADARRSALAEFEHLEPGADTLPPPETSEPSDTVAESVVEPVASQPEDSASDATVSQSRLMAVMDPDATRGSDADQAPAWEAPYAVSVAAGSSATGEPAEAQPQGRMGSTLLRTVRAIRPMASTDKDDSPR